MRLIDADALKRKTKKVATEARMLKLKANIETTLNQFIDWINEAQTIQLEPQWIPCSKKLPDEGVKVLIYASDLYYHTGSSNGILLGWQNGNYWRTYTAAGDELVRYPVAWMPLPEPYEEEKE